MVLSVCLRADCTADEQRFSLGIVLMSEWLKRDDICKGTRVASYITSYVGNPYQLAVAKLVDFSQ